MQLIHSLAPVPKQVRQSVAQPITLTWALVESVMMFKEINIIKIEEFKNPLFTGEDLFFYLFILIVIM